MDPLAQTGPKHAADDGIDRVNQPTGGCPWRYEDCDGPEHCPSGESCAVYLTPRAYNSWKYLMGWVGTKKRP